MSHALDRHRLVRLAPQAWREAIAAAPDADARSCLAAWCERDGPLVVTRQPEQDGHHVALGLPAPAAWQRRRLSLRVPMQSLRPHAPFPCALDALDLFDASMRAPMSIWLSDLALHARTVRVYGSLGWECLTGLAYRHVDSDLDLLVGVEDAHQADAACDRLDAPPCGPLPRVDGELVFPDGAGVSWRDWQAARRDASARMVVKRLRSVSLEARSAFLVGAFV